MSLTEAVKCAMVFFNILMTVVGGFIIYVFFDDISELPVAYIGYMYFIGVTCLLYGLLGFLGLLVENVCIMRMYSVITLVSVIGQVIFRIAVNDFDDLITEKAKEKVQTQWLKEIEQPGAMNAMQLEFACCGKDSPNDYVNILHRTEIPSSCYAANITALNEYQQSCLFRVQKRMIKSFGSSERIEWGIAIITAILFGFALYLTIHFMTKRRRYNYKI